LEACDRTRAPMCFATYSRFVPHRLPRAAAFVKALS
jgi:hypothetical protein